MVERTFMMIKPDGVSRGKIGEIIQRIEHKGYAIKAMKMVQPTPELLAKHYAEHVGKSFYPSLVQYMTSGPIIAMIGEDVVDTFLRYAIDRLEEKGIAGWRLEILCNDTTGAAVYID